ncbi:MAG: YggS family pyridoxal phosphate-dependent enzyme [Pseudomonadota bacterium]
MIGVTENLNVVRAQLHAALSAAGRDTKDVTLLAVSKRKPASAVRLLAEAGQQDFGENQLQEALAKQAELGDLDLTWHFIGSIQSNKTRSIAEHFDWVHAVDRLKIAQRLSDQRPDSLGDLNICLQVNIDNETSKSGAAIGDIPALARACDALPRLKLRGLMCLPAIRDNDAEQRKPFARLRELAESLATEGLSVDTLSMGMSGDYPAAIAEGATIVRIGTALFGARDNKDSHT